MAKFEINATLPFDRSDAHQEFLSVEAVTAIGQVLEQQGFSGGNVTDHPCPSARWLDNGGHVAQDPFVMLSLMAAATTTLRLQTGILVLPYRNPFVVARAAATLDVFSRGRLTLGLGAGYMKGEYFALGVEFNKRNELFDEYIDAMKAAWTGENFSFSGSGYNARDCRMQPNPIQTPHPPLFIGGNSKLAIRRAAEKGDGWYPFFTPAALASSARTASISNDEELFEGINYLYAHCDKIGREQRPKVFLGSIRQPGEELNAQKLLDKIGRYQEAGICGAVTHIEGTTRQEWCDNAEWLGTEVIKHLT